ncbi:MAG: phosphorylase [Coleofasciculaceae cyanobacterium]
MSNLSIQTILVPQCAEYQAVCRGLNQVNSAKPLVLPIPIGCKSLTQYLEKLQQSEHFLNSSQNILLMGLCGSLSAQYSIGDTVVYQECVDEKKSSQVCNSKLTELLQKKLKDKASLVKGLTSDRLIHLTSEKQRLGKLYNTEVVDMEGFAVLEVFKKVGIVRVISDDIHHNLPNLSSAISPDGSLLPLPLALMMMRQPIAATRLIRGSLMGLRVLENITTLLFAG